MAPEVTKANPNHSERDMLYSLFLAVGGTMIVQIPAPLRSYSERDILWSILLQVQGGLGSATNSGAGVPNNADGSDGDLYFDTTSKSVYRKESGAWVVVGTLAKSVTDAEVAFATPSAGDGTAQLTTP